MQSSKDAPLNRSEVAQKLELARQQLAEARLAREALSYEHASTIQQISTLETSLKQLMADHTAKVRPDHLSIQQCSPRSCMLQAFG